MFDSFSIQTAVQWIGDHESLSGFVVFLISLSESLAIVGLIVPGVVLMTAIGALIGAGHLPLLDTLLWAILGAIAGDGLSYWLGHHFHDHLRDFWPFRQFPTWLARGEVFFKHHGGKSIILGRFVGPIRPTIPVIAGMMGMTPGRFLFFNIASAIVWAPLYSLPGYLLGTSLGLLSSSPEIVTRFSMLILAFLLLCWLLYTFVLKAMRGMIRITSNLLSRAWTFWQRSHQLAWLHQLLRTAQGTETGQLGTALLFLLSLSGSLYLLDDISSNVGITRLNDPIFQALRALYANLPVALFTLISSLGNPVVILPVSLFVGIWLFWKHRYTAALCWFGIMGLGSAIGFGLQAFIPITRPEGLKQILLSEHSFPSLHTLHATLFYGLTAALLQHALPTQKLLPWKFALPIILMVAMSHLYLELHWFTDVLGGLCLGTVILSLGLLIYRRVEHCLPAARTVLWPCSISLLIALSIFNIKFYDQERDQVERTWPPAQTFSSIAWWQAPHPELPRYRNGAFKRHAAQFDIQWLGTLSDIQALLTSMQWTEVPHLTLKNALQMLAAHPNPILIPTLPEFHRDRLPVIIVTQELPNGQRMLLKLWEAGYLSEQGTPLWLGTVRQEEPVHILPFTTLYHEVVEHATHMEIEMLSTALHDHAWKTRRIAPEGHLILLIRNT